MESGARSKDAQGCATSKAYWPGFLMTQAPQLEVSKATHTATSGAQLNALSILSLSSPYLSIGTRPWLAATPMPTKDSLIAKDSNAHCWSLQILVNAGLAQAPRAFPLPSSWPSQTEVCTRVPYRTGSLSWGLGTLLRTLRDLGPFEPAFLQQMG